MTSHTDNIDSNRPSHTLVESLPAENTTPQTHFKFPFARPGSNAATTTDKPWQAKGINPRHEKRIGMAPRGTRRSMGKR